MNECKSTDVWDYTPCRTAQCYKDLGEKIEIFGIDGPIRLKGAGRMFWEMATGKNTLRIIVDTISETFNIADKDKILDNICKLARNLNQRELLILNWDPLFKNKIVQ